ncbi:MAG: citryl-CoA lyase [candidate division Zixibacteria bacterium]|nr:citryl-CoA lyase [candidate division Zixibacteria bacterium]
MSEQSWPSAISEIGPNLIRLRGYPVEELMGTLGFAEAIHLALLGELPDRATATILDAIFVSSLDHGTTPPSVLAARTVASTGAPLGSAVAAGFLAISKYHGGAIEDCMKTLEHAIAHAEKKNSTFVDAAATVVDAFKAKGQRISGFGHRLHTKDPRTTRLLALSDELGKSGHGVKMARAFVEVLAKSGTPLPLNVDGAIAAVLLDLKVPHTLANAFFMIARLPGLVAQAHEEQTRHKPMRTIDPKVATYDGPPLRHST